MACTASGADKTQHRSQSEGPRDGQSRGPSCCHVDVHPGLGVLRSQYARGSLIVNVEPFPGVESTATLPPAFSTT